MAVQGDNQSGWEFKIEWTVGRDEQWTAGRAGGWIERVFRPSRPTRSRRRHPRRVGAADPGSGRSWRHLKLEADLRRCRGRVGGCTGRSRGLITGARVWSNAPRAGSSWRRSLVHRRPNKFGATLAAASLRALHSAASGPGGKGGRTLIQRSSKTASLDGPAF
jgi:hypothetical protein